MSCHLMLRHVMRCHIMFCNVMGCHKMSDNVMCGHVLRFPYHLFLYPHIIVEKMTLNPTTHQTITTCLLSLSPSLQKVCFIDVPRPSISLQVLAFCSRLIEVNVALCDLMLCYVIKCHDMLWDVMKCHVM